MWARYGQAAIFFSEIYPFIPTKVTYVRIILLFFECSNMWGLTL
jgi:hypothetical protein